MEVSYVGGGVGPRVDAAADQRVTLARSLASLHLSAHTCLTKLKGWLILRVL